MERYKEIEKSIIKKYRKFLTKTLDFEIPQMQAGIVEDNGFRAHSPYRNTIESQRY